jgi:ABC-type branched-subunit amino acid transport system substrate-binding protein
VPQVSKQLVRAIALSLPLLLVGAGCSSDPQTKSSTGSALVAKHVDYVKIGLWDDGPCNASKPKLKLGLMTVFENPVLTLKPQADALVAAATAFNKRGGANGSCIEVHTCDDGANLDQSLACVRKIDKAGVVATVNDQGVAGQAEVSAAMAAAKIPRIASNVTNNDWGDPNAYPIDASSTGFVFVLPEALLREGVKRIGLIRVDLAAAGALKSLLQTIYGRKGATFVSDTPVPAGTTDFSQFILKAQDANADGVAFALGDQEVLQVVRAGQQLGTHLQIGTSPGPVPHDELVRFGDFAKQFVFVSSFPPATVDLPVYKALRADLAASGDDALKPATMTLSPMRSWIGLYALLKMIRDAKLTSFTRDNITKLLQSAKDVSMLGMFDGESWTPNKNHAGLFKRAGTNHWAFYRFDPTAKAPDGLTGNFVEKGTMNFDQVLCGTAIGAPPPCGTGN